MHIRSVRLADLVRHWHLYHQTNCYATTDSVAAGLSPYGAAVRSWLPGSSGLRTLVLADGEPHAFVQVATRDHGRVWSILGLGQTPRPQRPLALDDAAHPWRVLLNALATVAARRRATRLLARVPAEDPCLASYRAAGFQAYGRELVLERPYAQTDRVTEAVAAPHVQRAGDAWAIHRLYFQTTPQPIQVAEALTSNHWDADGARFGLTPAEGWLFHDGDEVRAYVRAVSQRHVHLLSCLYHPAWRERLGTAVRQVLAHLPASPGDRVIWRLPEHQAEALPLLADLGFSHVTDETLLVRFLAIGITAREHSFRRTPARSGLPSVEGMPRRDQVRAPMRRSLSAD